MAKRSRPAKVASDVDALVALAAEMFFERRARVSPISQTSHARVQACASVAGQAFDDGLAVVVAIARFRRLMVFDGAIQARIFVRAM